MSRYVIQRLLAMVVVLLGVSVIVFGLIHVTPGDPAQIMLGPQASAQQINELRHELGLDQPIYVQYVRWLGNIVRGDFGNSIVLRRPVLTEVLQRFGHTAILAGAAILISFSAGIFLGAVSAIYRGSIIDRVTILFATVGLSLPSFWFALTLLIIFSLKLHMSPGTGMVSAVNGGGIRDVLGHLILPAVSLAVVPMAVIARYTRSNMLEVISQEYVTTARAKGLQERVILSRHVFKNTLVVLVTMLGLQVGYLLAGAVYIENVFSWPGIGQMLVEAILKRDFPLVQGGVLVVASVYVIINLATDLAYAYLDPRVRFS